MARPFDSEEGCLQILSGQGGGVRQGGIKCWFKREAEDNFPRDFNFFCADYRYVYIVYM